MKADRGQMKIMVMNDVSEIKSNEDVTDDDDDADNPEKCYLCFASTDSDCSIPLSVCFLYESINKL